MRHHSNLIMAKTAAALICMGLIAGCREPRPQDATPHDNAAEPSQRPSLPIVEPPLNRAQLLLSVARAASAHSLGMTDPGVQRSLDGKQFEVRLRFGCEGPGPGSGDHGWSLDPDGRTLRLRAVPSISLDDDVARSVAEDKVESVEGFWLPRPWLLHAECLPAEQLALPAEISDSDPQKSQENLARPAMPAAPAIQRIGIAQFLTAEDARTRLRMDRPFEAVKQLDGGEQARTGGFELVLSGRLRAHGDGRVILCSGAGRDRPPDCIVSATVDRVRIERPEDKAVMADWRA